ncbi:MAG: EAL domain-containing protein [Lachnospiraceae bacterium]|nr:EAL domain-containing protein [Lachnospiraceae bacterium]
MNIQVQLCGMFILVLLALFYKSNITLQLYAEKVFFRAMCVSIISLSLDILSLVVISSRQNLPVLLVQFVCKSYVISLIWVGMSALLYVMTDIFSERMHERRTKQVVGITILQSLLVYILPISIFEEGESIYTYGPAVLCVYGFAVLYVAATIVILWVYRSRVNKRREFAVGLWMGIWILAAVIQFFNNELLVVGFASAIGVLILLVIMENPESNLDRRWGCFNSYALSEYVTQLMGRKEKFCILELSFSNADLLRGHNRHADERMRSLLYLLKKQKGVKAFKNVNAGLCFISAGEEQLKQVAGIIIEFFARDEALYEEVHLALVQSAGVFVNVEELFRFLNFINMEYGKNGGTLVLADEALIQRYREQYVIEQKISDALEEDRVEVFLQPIFSNEEKKFTSAEALVRIREKSGELLSPGLFIPVAEETGQILELGERVFEKVCDFLKNTEVIQLGIHYIEVNLSVIQCERSDLADRLIEIIEKYGVNPEFINLEITETASISARTTLLDNMKKLIEYGFSFSLDDFGKGESNLMYVVEMPVSIVKLDYDMSKAFFNSPKAKHVVRAVVGMAHGMDLKLVAEGIETREEIDGMYQEGIDYIQGFYYSRPLQMEHFLQFLKKSFIKQKAD